MNALLDKLKAASIIDSSLSTRWLNHFYFAVLKAAWQALQDGNVVIVDVPELAWRSLSKGVAKTN